LTSSAPQSFVDVVRERADRLGERRAFTFLADGEEPAEHLTYAGLDRRAREVGVDLQRRGAAGERVLLLFPPGLDFVAAFLGCLYAGAVAVPAYPPSPGRGTGRLRSLLADARPRLALTVSPWLDRVERELAGAVETAVADGLPAGLAEDWRSPGAGPSTLAFLQYTSGSTSTPKGVQVTHGNLLANERAIQRAFGQSEESVVVGWLPLYHDMGLIGNVLQPIWCGGSCVLMSPLSILQRPRRWLEAISRFRGTTSGGPDFAYALCVRKMPPPERAGLDLSSWRVAFNGAEPVRAATLDAFAEAFAPCGFRRRAFYPCYGLAEATLFVSGGEPDVPPVVQAEAGKLLVGCGRIWSENGPGERLAIVDPETGSLAPAGQEGEVWVAGPSVAGGYWNRPEETERTFGARLAETGEGPFLRTGDLGLLSPEGELFVTGRLKDLIVVRGRNLYPHDLERTAEESHPALRPGGAAAFSVEAEGEERLVVVVEVERRREAESREAAEAVRAAVLKEHEAAPWEVVPIRAGTLPKTSSGKVRRAACREAYVAGELIPGRGSDRSAGSVRSDGSDLGMRTLAARLLRVSPESLDPEAPLPLDSLLALELKNRLESDFGLRVPLSLLLDGVSLRHLTSLPFSPLPLAGEGPGVRAWVGEAPLSPGQLSLWLAHRMAPESPVYNLALAARVALEPEILRRALERLVARHAVLRTTYPLVAGEPVQRIGEEGAVDFAVLEPRLRRLEEEAWRPFDLERGPVVRLRLFRAPAGRAPVLLLALHHIAADFWSLGLLLEDLARLAAADTEEAPASPMSPIRPPITYAEWTLWQRERLAGLEGDRLWAEWRDALAGAPVVLDLPSDRPRPPVPTHRGVSHPFSLGPELSERVRALAAASGSTLYAVLLAAFAALLQRHTGREDLLVGTAAAGRTRPGLEEVAGHFVNLLPVRADLAGDPALAELLARARRAVVGALERQDFPFSWLVERLAPARDPARHPLVQVALVLEQPRRLQGGAAAPFVLGRGGAPLRVDGLALEPVELPRPATPFDLTLLAVETGGTVEASLELSADLFDPATAARLAGRFLTLLAAAVADSSRRLSELPALAEAERAQLLMEWNDTAAPISDDSERCAHELFEDWADRTPEAPALIGADGKVWIYRELEARANQLAHHLRSLGVGPEAPVALVLERSPELWLTALAALKAGGFYVPVDPAWPRERIDLVLADCGARAVVTADTLVTVSGDRSARPARNALPDNTAYGLYTSGSTGRPKEVLVPHRPLVNLVHQGARELRVGPGSRMLQIAAPVFDASVLEVFLALTSGAALCLASEEARLSGPRLAAEMRTRGVTWATLTPSAARFLPEEEIPSLETLALGGEAMPGPLAARWSGRLRLFNFYGPAEAAVYVAAHHCRPGDAEAPPIGRPIANARLHVLGPWSREPLPVGVPGELHAGGMPPGRGYFGRPDLTAERWVPDPFGGLGDRLYRTGDLARWRPDGRLDFLGRIDTQVKLRGVRIEPGEIEAALARYPQVKEAVVTARQGAAGEPVLVAYVVLRGEAGDLSGGLRAFLAERLPAALIPAAFVVLPALPMTAVGKVDLAALPTPASGQEGAGALAALPRTEMERTVAAVWREVLGVEEVGLDRNFFELGGHSLLLARAHARLCEVLGQPIPLSEMFSHPTVSSLAARLSVGRREERDDAREIHDRAAARRAAMDRRRGRARA
jgi:amino acid adenylation domain-containing protein